MEVRRELSQLFSIQDEASAGSWMDIRHPPMPNLAWLKAESCTVKEIFCFLDEWMMIREEYLVYGMTYSRLSYCGGYKMAKVPLVAFISSGVLLTVRNLGRVESSQLLQEMWRVISSRVSGSARC
jgi:hypothetical protein